MFSADESELGWLGRAKNWIALAILVCMLVGIATERVHRMRCAFAAAAAMMGLLLWMNLAPGLKLVSTRRANLASNRPTCRCVRCASHMHWLDVSVAV